MEQKEFLQMLKAHKQHLTKQQFKTIKGQALAGDVEGANKGLQKLMERNRKQWEEQSPRCSLCRQPSSYHM